MTTQRVVVVGAGQAGCQLVSSLREGGFRGDITLVGSEAHIPYQRPPLSKGYLTGSTDLTSLWLRPEQWFADQAVDVRLGVEVTAIHRQTKTLSITGQPPLDYDVLVIATGARNRGLPVQGADLGGVHYLRDLDEANQLRQSFDVAERVVVVGGGFIGMEVAATAATLGKATTVIESAPQLMGRVLSTRTASFLLDAHRQRGLAVELGTGVTSIEGTSGRATAVVTGTGTRVAADLVVVGIGAQANDHLAWSAGLAVDNGIVVDRQMRTTDENIFAIGDCASGPNPFASADRIRLESVQNAVAQARCVAATIAGSPTECHDVPWFWSDQGELKLQIAGLTTGHDETVVSGDILVEKFSTYCFRSGQLVAVESINRPADHMAARRLLASPTPPTAEQVRDTEFNPKAFLSGPAKVTTG